MTEEPEIWIGVHAPYRSLPYGLFPDQEGADAYIERYPSDVGLYTKPFRKIEVRYEESQTHR